LDRLRKLYQQTIRNSDNPVEQAVIPQEADRTLSAAFRIGLIGAPGRQDYRCPSHKTLNMAITATNAEKKEASVRQDWGTSDRTR
jgi:hypothetical protein